MVKTKKIETKTETKPVETVESTTTETEPLVTLVTEELPSSPEPEPIETPPEEPKVDPLIEAIKQLPEPEPNPTSRWYGEVFLKQYNTARSTLRRLAGLQ